MIVMTKTMIVVVVFVVTAAIVIMSGQVRRWPVSVPVVMQRTANPGQQIDCREQIDSQAVSKLLQHDDPRRSVTLTLAPTLLPLARLRQCKCGLTTGDRRRRALGGLDEIRRF